MTDEQQQLVSNCLKEEGITRFGWAPLKRPFSFELYESWIENGFHGEMEYLARHSPQKSDPAALLPRARSALVIAFDYGPGSEFAKVSKKHFPLQASRVALYARGDDYHVWLTQKLDRIIAKLKLHFKDDIFKAHSDSSPILERDLAARAGLGWVGKNSCLVDTKAGSLFFIAEILTSLSPTITADLHADRCGTCTRCIDVCPTQAIVKPRELDARLCISYLTIESKNPPPVQLRPFIGDWLYGCDLCQTVCPWNEKAHGKDAMRAETQNTGADQELLIKELKWLLSSTDKEIESAFASTPLLRRKAFGLKRNALIVAVNRKLVELESEIETFRDRLEPSSPKAAGLYELSNWALDNLKTPAT